MIHTIMASYLGDGEIDIGRTGVWAGRFTDQVFFYDGFRSDKPRRFAIDYAKTFPDTKFAYHDTTLPTMMRDPARFRRESFRAADQALSMSGQDWVLFCDASEGIGISNSYDEVNGSLLMLRGDNLKHLYELTELAAGPTVSLPVHVFLSQHPTGKFNYWLDEFLGIESFVYTCTPTFLEDPAAPTKSLVRLARVAALRHPSFDWSSLDTWAFPAVPSPQPRRTDVLPGDVSIITFGYARWSQEDYYDPSLWVEANDLGFANRLVMERFRPVGLPTVYGTPDPAGVSNVARNSAWSSPYFSLVEKFDSLVPPGPPPGPRKVGTWDTSDTGSPVPAGGVRVNFGGPGTWNMSVSYTTASGTVLTFPQVEAMFPVGQPFEVDFKGTRYLAVPEYVRDDEFVPGQFNLICPEPFVPPAPPSPNSGHQITLWSLAEAGGSGGKFCTLVRSNPRDGVWYLPGEEGPPPVDLVTGEPV